MFWKPIDDKAGRTEGFLCMISTHKKKIHPYILYSGRTFLYASKMLGVGMLLHLLKGRIHYICGLEFCFRGLSPIHLCICLSVYHLCITVCIHGYLFTNLDYKPVKLDFFT